MSNTIEIKIPDIGDFDGVDVIEVLMSVDQEVAKEASILTLESDKATMEIPSPESGVITEIRVAVGDVVKQGDVVAMLQVSATSGGDEVSEDPAISEDRAASEEQSTKTEPLDETPEVVETQQQATAPVVAAPQTAPAVSVPDGGLPHASPAVRRFARE